MKNIELGYYTTAEELKEFVEQLKSIDSLTVANIGKTDSNGLFSGYNSFYLTVEYKNSFFYIQRSNEGFDGFYILPYVKISPWEQKQAEYPKNFNWSVDMIEWLKNKTVSGCKIPGTFTQRIYLDIDFFRIYDKGITGMQMFKSQLGYREKEIFNSLEKIEMIQNTNDYQVLRFHSADKFFDYECNSKTITV